jgi:cyclopropane fatty-acyl-phospholipid synthase-like methyltransferase
VWPRAKVEVSQRVFGRGFLAPGGPDHVIDIVKSIGLDPVQTVLDLSMGLGGPGAAMAGTYGVWITGYERNPALFDIAATVLPTLKAGDQVRTNFFDPETVELPRKKFDVVLSGESMHGIQNRVALIQKIFDSLKDWGQFLMSDFVVPDESTPSERLKTWMQNRGEPVTLWTRQQYEVALSNQKFDVRSIKDESKVYVDMIRHDFASFVATLNADKAVTETPIGRAALMDLAEDWSRLATLLQDGELQLLRFLAMKPEET